MKSLLTIYKFIVGLLLNYVDIACCKIFNESFKRKLEVVQYNDRLAITGLIRRTYQERFYHELGLESQVILNDHRNYSFSIKLPKDFDLYI